MKNIKIISIILIYIVTQSCNVLNVNKGSEKIDGIPFYGHKEIINQKTRYLFDWLEVTLVRENKIGEAVITTNIFKGNIKSDTDLNEIYTRLSILSVGGIKEDDMKTYLTSLEPIDFADISSVILIDNNWKKELAVDYSKVMYLNAKMPWFGSSTLTQKINPNGTLAESSASTDSQIDELITSVAGLAAPFLTFKTEKLKLSEEDKDDMKSMTKKQINALKEAINNTSYKLEIKQKGFIYTFTRQLDYVDMDTIDPNIPIPLCQMNGNYTRTDWTGKSNSPQKKSDKPTIGISGSIVLPEKK